MAIRKIARLGHPVLRQRARELSRAEIGSAPIRSLIADLIETMREYGGVGIAAPQVHESVRLALIEFGPHGARYPGPGTQPLSVFINPTVTVLDDQRQSYWEGCLSVPGLRGLVHRPRKVRVDYVDADANPRELVAEGFLATVFQHELDHLDGVLYVDRLDSAPGTTPLAFQEEYQKYLVPNAADAIGELSE
jgi:peptide deformylase